ncbi:MAG: hypothetical protein IJD64_04090 [Clostridia bacterium]|nr:hypothetical protein [Clostridia bacterium]
MEKKEEIKILCDNIEIFSNRKTLSEKQRALAMSQWLSRFLSESDDTPSHLYDRFCSSFTTEEIPTPEDRALLCAQLANHPSFQKKLLSHSPLEGREGAASGSHGRIALVRNRYNEEAFSIFEHTVQGAKPEFFSSFSDACEEVFDNLCEYCILPVENTGDGRLFGFYSMIDRYELKICSVCELETESPPETIRYALVGKHLPRRIPQNTDWNFECCVSAEAEEFPYDIFRVAPVFSATPIKIDSLPILYDDRAHRFYLTFRVPRHLAYAFDLYLSKEHPRYTAIGLYPILEI